MQKIYYFLIFILIFLKFNCYNKIRGGNNNCPKNYKLLNYEDKIVNDIKIISRYDIYINKNQTIVYKIINNTKLGVKLKKSIQTDNDFNIYKNILENAHKKSYNHTIPVFDIERNGSYKSKYINGYRIDKLNKSINKNLLKKIIFQINILKKDLYNNEKILSGDWALHNLIYSIEDDKIYNVDIEGFYTYQKIPEWVSIDMFNYAIDDLLNNL